MRPTHMYIVTTRTTSLTPVPLTSFALRFSDLGEVEDGCREDEELRAGRTMDWISARISSRCAKWLEDWEQVEAAAAQNDRASNLRTPWWNELRHCVDGDHIPSKFEGWNHPVASACFSYTGQVQGPEHLHSRIRRVYYVVQSSTDFGTAARSSFRTAFMGGQHTSTVFADRPS
jgi:hypothetical protein